MFRISSRSAVREDNSFLERVFFTVHRIAQLIAVQTEQYMTTTLALVKNIHCPCSSAREHPASARAAVKCSHVESSLGTGWKLNKKFPLARGHLYNPEAVPLSSHRSQHSPSSTGPAVYRSVLQCSWFDREVFPASALCPRLIMAKQEHLHTGLVF